MWAFSSNITVQLHPFPLRWLKKPTKQFCLLLHVCLWVLLQVCCLDVFLLFYSIWLWSCLPPLQDFLTAFIHFYQAVQTWLGALEFKSNNKESGSELAVKELESFNFPLARLVKQDGDTFHNPCLLGDKKHQSLTLSRQNTWLCFAVSLNLTPHQKSSPPSVHRSPQDSTHPPAH